MQAAVRSAEQALRDASAAREAAGSLAKQIDAGHLRLQALAAEAKRVEEQHAQAKVAAGVAESQRQTLAEQLGDGPTDAATVKAQRDEAVAKADQLDAEAARRGRAFDSAKQTHGLAEAAVANAEREVAAAESEVTEAQASLVEALARHGFADADAVEQAVLGSAELESLDETVKTYDRERHAAEQADNEAQAAAKGLVEPDLAALEQAATDAATQAKAKVQEQVQLKQQGEVLDQHASKLADLRAEHEEASVTFKTIGQLAEWASGINEMKLRFHRFVLGFLLDEVLEQASKRLERMTRGRFTLSRRVENNAAHQGLELDVEDAHTGEARPVSTLSGGEGFMAALSMALALAEVVQAHAGGRRMDAVFIDEGFGTLDAEALDTAVRTLVDLASDRMVGLISHVGELGRQIPARLEVTPSPTGSTARFVV